LILNELRLNGRSRPCGMDMDFVARKRVLLVAMAVEGVEMLQISSYCALDMIAMLTDLHDPHQ